MGIKSMLVKAFFSFYCTGWMGTRWDFERL
jgi:hypothetical protein